MTDAGYRADVAQLKGDLAHLKEQFNRMELSHERRFNRIDAQFERLIALVQRAETKDC